MDKLKIAKRTFQKYGLSEKVLSEIVALLPEVEDATEETIIEQLQAYELIAKSFQSEIERRLASTKKKDNEPNPKNDEDEGKSDNNNNDTIKLLLKLNERLDKMEKGQISSTLNQSAIEKLKAIKMTDKEIEAVMFGRSFETEEAVEEFVTKQSEYFEEITATRLKDNAGGGFNPKGSQGEYSKKAMEQDVEEFNKQF